MTHVLAPDSAANTTAAPLAATTARLSALHERFDVRVGPLPDAAWILTTELATPGAPHLERLLTAAQAHYDITDRKIAVSFFLNGYSWALAAASLGCYLLERRVPDLTPSRVGLHFGPTGRATGVTYTDGRFWALPNDPAADHAAAHIVASRDALRDVFRTQLEAHMQALIPALREQSAFGTRALWITVADRCAGFLFWVHQQQPALLPREQLIREVDALVQAPGSLFNNKLTSVRTACDHDADSATGAVTFQRGACCLNYKRAEGKYCASCPITAQPCD